MKRARKFLAILLAGCMLLSLTACGKKSADDIINEAQKKCAAATGFSGSYSFDCLGAIGEDGVSLEGRYTWQQGANGDLYQDLYNTAKIGTSSESESLRMYFTEGKYYYEKDETLYTCSEAIASPAQAPGTEFWPILAAAEKAGDEKANDAGSLTCTATLTGDNLKNVLKELCYNVYKELAPFADWASASGNFNIKLNEGGYLERIEISAPELGKALISVGAGGKTVTCSDFDIEVLFSYYEECDPIDPENPAGAKSSKAIETYGMAALIKDMMGANDEQKEIDAENDAAANFTQVKVDKGASVTLSSNGKQVKVTIPADVKTYSSGTQHSPALLLITHDVMESVSGTTRIEVGRATLEQYFGSLYSQSKELSAGGFTGRVYVTEKQEENYFGKMVVSKDIYFAVDLGDGETVLAIHASPSFEVSKGNLMDESIVKKVLENCKLVG